MFEKDAEEWVKENMDCCKTDNSVNQPIPYFDEEERCCAKSAFQDGAEFGYNKANEWHKADVPTSPINKVVLGYIKHYNSKLFCLVGWNGKWWYDAGTYNDEVKLIAWKEIVLPKEIK